MGKLVEKAVRQFNLLIKEKYVSEDVKEPKAPWDQFYTFCTILTSLLNTTELFWFRPGWRNFFQCLIDLTEVTFLTYF